jgi:chromosomal replication initiation ATPase DnaA
MHPTKTTKESIVDISIIEMTKRFQKPKELSLAEIFEDCCMIFNQKPEVVNTTCRKGDLVSIRRIFCYVSYKISKYNLREIGEFLNCMDHTSVIHNRNKVIGFLKVQDPKFIVQWQFYTSNSRIWQEYNQK